MSDAARSGEPDAASVADRISAYLQGHPGACDTAEGIATWWLSESAVPASLVDAALELLVRGGQVVRITQPGGTARYARKSPGAAAG